MTGLKRYVLFHPNGNPPLEEVDLIKRNPGFSIVDDATGRAFLVEANCEAIDDLRRRMPCWVCEEEQIHPAS
jgi:hypothetical protein